ncbi:hypothetical protein [Massilia antarctica]|uniref:hypothetical protein n=1 Tax=Massilia antarctica TaxID=2765360 RepID=UPI0022704BB5|nr:hypothetical protein [Massilia sp. H27-R4]MCY0914034.1 hypothetical protein [Massilia sp. H27-R4]
MQGAVLKELVGKPQEASGNVSEIGKKIQSCVVKIFLSGDNLGIDRKDKSAPLFELNDPEAGLLVFRGKVLGTGWADTWTAARYTIEVKPQKFRLTLSGFHRDNIGNLAIGWGTGGEQLIKVLEASGDQLAACAKQQSDW